jgi:hypothetical protein
VVKNSYHELSNRSRQEEENNKERSIKSLSLLKANTGEEEV